jgi:hypothetical protein
MGWVGMWGEIFWRDLQSANHGNGGRGDLHARFLRRTTGAMEACVGVARGTGAGGGARARGVALLPLAARFGDGGGQQRAGARERRSGARRWRRTAKSGGAREESGGWGDDRRQNRAPKIVDAYTSVLSSSRDKWRRNMKEKREREMPKVRSSVYSR